MPTHHQELLHAILDVIQTRYAEDVSIMFIYGSYVQGLAQANSDLDMIFVPKTERGRQLARTFLLEGTGNDLWGVSWERLERYANFEDMKVAVLADSSLVYYASKEDKQLYVALLERVAEISAGPLTPRLIELAEKHLCMAKQYFGALCLGEGFTEVGGILYEISDVLCLLNHTYLRFGVKRILEELTALKRQPVGLGEALNAVIGSESQVWAREACARLISMVEAFLQECQKELASPADPAGFTGLYEEIASHWNKIRRSCALGDAPNALMAATSLQAELDQVQRQLGINQPELHFIDTYHPQRLTALSVAAQKAEDAFLALLRDARVPLRSYDSVTEFKKALLNE